MELVFINDGSPDNVWDTVLELSHQYTWVRGICLMKNYGQHNAVLCGIRAARYSVIVTMDDDLQHPPEEIPTLLATLDKGYDVVYGSPIDLPHGFMRNMASTITKIVLQRAMSRYGPSH